MHAQCVSLPVCVPVGLCSHVHWDQQTLQELVARKHHSLSSSPVLVAKPPEPSILEVTRARGARQAELRGKGGRTPMAAPHSYSGMKHVIFTQGGWGGWGGPRR